MNQDRGKKRTAALQQVAHYLVGFAILMKGVEKAEHFSDHPRKVIVLFLVGAVVFALVASHHWLERRFPRANVTALVYLAESTALLTAGLALLEEGRSRVPYLLFFLAIVFAINGFANLLTRADQKEMMNRRLTLGLGLLFPLAGSVALLLNWLGSGSLWVYGIGTLFWVAGAGLIGRHLHLRKRMTAAKNS